MEYVVYDIPHRKFHWFALNEGFFEALTMDGDGFFRSRAFPGLWVHEAAFVEGNGRQVLAGLHRGLETREHGDFVDRLRQNRANRP